jgi:hypothetical protein
MVFSEFVTDSVPMALSVGSTADYEFARYAAWFALTIGGTAIG